MVAQLDSERASRAASGSERIIHGIYTKAKREGRKAFFFEKKKQKTGKAVPGLVPGIHAVRRAIGWYSKREDGRSAVEAWIPGTNTATGATGCARFFGPVIQKKTAFFLTLLAP